MMDLNIDEKKLFNKQYEGTYNGSLAQGGNTYQFSIHLTQLGTEIFGKIDDALGHAIFAGFLSGSRVSFMKKYESGHSRGYEFYYDGILDTSEPGISGRWNQNGLPSNNGTFHISLRK